MDEVLLDRPVQQRFIVPSVEFNELPILLNECAESPLWMNVRRRSLHTTRQHAY